VDFAINNIPQIYPNASIDNFVIMPNHIHIIIFLHTFKGSSDNGRLLIAPTKEVSKNTEITISQIIKQMKRYVTKKCGYEVFQKSFYDHIIRNQHDYETKWRYIDDNPAKWVKDEYF